MKHIVLIRHGESLGQTARSRGQSRKDPDLTDCFLSDKGIYQARSLTHNLPSIHGEPIKFDLVCTSPLTRAIATCALGLGHIPVEELKENGIMTTPFICHPNLAEVGGGIPENKGRPIKKVYRDIRSRLKPYIDISCLDPCLDCIDFSLLPPSWPELKEKRSKKTNLLTEFLEWLHDRPENNIAIVCHHNVIHGLLRYAISHVPNCSPITCVMNEGDVESLHLQGGESDKAETFCKVRKPNKNQKPPVSMNLSARGEEMVDILYGHITPNRLSNVLSKHSGQECITEIDSGHICKLLTQDVFEEFNKDHSEAFEALDTKEVKRIKKRLGSNVMDLVRKTLDSATENNSSSNNNKLKK